MNVVMPDDGLKTCLKRMIAQDLVYHLFTNDATVDKSTVKTDFIEAGVPGYASITVAEADWGTPSVTAHVSAIIAAMIVFACTSPNEVDCYGYYVTDANTNELVAAAKFDSGPIRLTVAGIPVLPILGSSSRFG